MRVNFHPSLYFNSYQNSFTSNERIVYDKSVNKVKWRNTTVAFRWDLNWYNFAEFVDKKYANVKKVNTVCYGCSDGSEPYTLFFALNKIAPDNIDKFLPIKAKDIDKYMINQCNRGYLRLYCDDLYEINKATDGKSTDYFSIYNTRKKSVFDTYVKQDLKSKVDFSQADIVEDIDNLPDKNNIILCRNFWPYLSQEDRISLVNKLALKLDSSSLVVIGSYDSPAASNLLRSAGFVQILENVFEKKSKNISKSQAIADKIVMENIRKKIKKER